MIALGCGASDNLPTLSPSDVANLPSGNAVGTSFSGLYVLKSSMLEGCDCRAGSCSRWHGSKADTFMLSETDGALNIVDHGETNDSIYDGGIDSNGNFRVGGGPVVDTAKGYSLLWGRVVGGSSIDAESRFTFVGPIAGDHYDCDLAGKLVLSYVKPL